MSPGRVALGAAGAALAAYGAVRLLTEVRPHALLVLGLWLAAAVVLHDGVVAPLTGLVGLLNDTAEPSVGWLRPSDPHFGKPENRYGFDPAKGKALLAAAGFTPQKPLKFKVMISASGSGQMLPLPMNEYMQQNLREACGVNVTFEVAEWNTLLTAVRSPPGGGTHLSTRIPLTPR